MTNDPSFMSEGRSHMAVSSEADNTFDSFLLDDYAPSHNGNMAVPAGKEDNILDGWVSHRDAGEQTNSFFT